MVLVKLYKGDGILKLLIVFPLLWAVLLTTAPTGGAKSVINTCRYGVTQVYKERGYTRNLERKMGHSPSRSSFNASTTRSCAYVWWVRNFWREQHAQRANEYRHWLKQRKVALASSWLVGAFECIHRYEGPWDAATGNGYYGGLQMDYPFQKLYGSQYLRLWGTANNWPPNIQIAVAITAYHTRGFGPWPNTARACGLL